jgi:hypothetical protein
MKVFGKSNRNNFNIHNSPPSSPGGVMMADVMVSSVGNGVRMKEYGKLQ